MIFKLNFYLWEKLKMNHNGSNCKNCSYEIAIEENYKFCPKCGQSLDTHRINFHYVTHELQHGILHVDKGILNTGKALFTKPGIMVREYLEGKRKNHFSPIIFIVILCTLLTLIKHYVYNDDILNAMTSESASGRSEISNIIFNVFKPAINWMYKNLVLFYLLQIPLMSIGFWIAFKKMTKYNFFEWMLIYAFCLIQIMIVSIVFQLLNKILPGVLLLAAPTSFLLTSWTIFQALSKYDFTKVFINFILGYIINFSLMMILTIIIVAYFLNTHPELLSN